MRATDFKSKKIKTLKDMKTLKNILYLFLIAMASVACERDYMAPPLSVPEYTGAPSNVLIAELKSKFSAIKTPTLIEDAFILRAIVVGNDESGNIYKQLFIQDETAGINIGIDQNSMYTSYRVGQEIFINLQGLYMLKYGEELQIGYGDTNANRISWTKFKEKTSINGWPDASKARAKVLDLAHLDPNMVNTFVRLEQIRFTNGGKNTFTIGENTSNESIKDGQGNTLDVRTSSFANFAKDILPLGQGSIEGILGRYNGAWQFYLRTKDDIKVFDGLEAAPDPEQAGEITIFNETFGDKSYPSGNRPKIAEFADFDMKAPIHFTEGSGSADIRSVSGDNGAHIWLPANRDVTLQVAGIPTAGKEKLKLSFQIAANVGAAIEAIDLNVMQLKCNGLVFNLPSQVVSNTAGESNKFFTFSVENIPEAESLTIEFITRASTNTTGLRLDNIKLSSSTGGGNGPIVLQPN